MTNFGGHVFPGTMFLLVGIWWTVQILRRYYRARYTGGTGVSPQKQGRFVSSLTFPIQTRCGIFSIESFMTISASLTGTLLELVIVNPSGQQTITPVNIQHATLYFTYGMAFLSPLVLPKFKVMPEVDSLTYLNLIIALLTEYLILMYHSMGSGGVHQLMHTLLRYPVLGCAVMSGVEIMYRESVLVALIRSFCMMLHGIWFTQVGFIVAPPWTNPWGTEETVFKNEHKTMMVQTCVFTWYMMGLFVFILICSAVIGRYYREQQVTDKGTETLLQKDVINQLLRYSLLPQKDEEM